MPNEHIGFDNDCAPVCVESYAELALMRHCNGAKIARLYRRGECYSESTRDCATDLSGSAGPSAAELFKALPDLATPFFFCATDGILQSCELKSGSHTPSLACAA
jgi:hypothetical protein